MLYRLREQASIEAYQYLGSDKNVKECKKFCGASASDVYKNEHGHLVICLHLGDVVLASTEWIIKKNNSIDYMSNEAFVLKYYPDTLF
jgi:hypothetical protein